MPCCLPLDFWEYFSFLRVFLSSCWIAACPDIAEQMRDTVLCHSCRETQSSWQTLFTGSFDHGELVLWHSLVCSADYRDQTVSLCFSAPLSKGMSGWGELWEAALWFSRIMMPRRELNGWCTTKSKYGLWLKHCNIQIKQWLFAIWVVVNRYSSQIISIERNWQKGV